MEAAEEIKQEKNRFSFKIGKFEVDKILLFCINFVICANIIVFVRNDVRPVGSFTLIINFFPTSDIAIHDLLKIPPFNITCRPLQNIILSLLGLISWRAYDVFFFQTLIFSPFIIFMFRKYLDLYKFENTTKNILLLLFSTIIPFQNFALGVNSDFMFILFFLISLYYLKLEDTKLFLIFSILAVLSKEVAIILPVMYFFINLDTSNRLFNKVNLRNILLGLPVGGFVFVTRILMNQVTYSTILGVGNMTLAIPEKAIPASLCFLGILWFIPILVKEQIIRFDKIYLGVLFGIYLPLVIIFGSIWELKIMVPFAIGFVPIIGYWIEKA